MFQLVKKKKPLVCDTYRLNNVEFRTVKKFAGQPLRVIKDRLNVLISIEIKDINNKPVVICKKKNNDRILSWLD